MTFGQRLKELRERAGLTQAQLAERSGVPLGTIRDYEQVKRSPLLPTAVSLAKALGVSIEVFAACDGEVSGSGGRAAPKLRGRPRRGG
jgi:transcriptional regulator with XRE-family HTH domain